MMSEKEENEAEQMKTELDGRVKPSFICNCVNCKWLKHSNYKLEIRRPDKNINVRLHALDKSTLWHRWVKSGKMRKDNITNVNRKEAQVTGLSSRPQEPFCHDGECVGKMQHAEHVCLVL